MHDVTIRLLDLQRSEEKLITIDEKGMLEFQIDRPAGFQFYRYETQ